MGRFGTKRKNRADSKWPVNTELKTADIRAIIFVGPDFATIQITEEARQAIIAATKIDNPTANLDKSV